MSEHRPTRNPKLEAIGHASRLWAQMTEKPDHYGFDVDGIAPDVMGQQLKSAMGKMGMPRSIQVDDKGGFRNEDEGVGKHILSGLRTRVTGYESPIYVRKDDQGRPHSDDGPAIVTNRGTMLFMKDGQLTPGPDGFAAVTAQGAGYRNPAHAFAVCHRALRLDPTKTLDPESLKSWKEQLSDGVKDRYRRTGKKPSNRNYKDMGREL